MILLFNYDTDNDIIIIVVYVVVSLKQKFRYCLCCGRRIGDHFRRNRCLPMESRQTLDQNGKAIEVNYEETSHRRNRRYRRSHWSNHKLLERLQHLREF